MNRRILGLSLMLCGSVVGVLAAGANDDAKQLQGTWQVVVGKVGDKDAGEEFVKAARLIFKDDKVTFKSGKEENTATFKLDLKPTPRHMNTLIEDGQSKGQVRLAVYELTGDTLRIRWGRGDKRPGVLRTNDGENFIYMELKRTTSVP